MALLMNKEFLNFKSDKKNTSKISKNVSYDFEIILILRNIQ